MILKPRGLLTLEFPHLLRLISESQFDTIYHEHLSYFSLGTVRGLFERHGLSVVDVEELWSHGGSLRLHVRHRERHSRAASERVASLVAREEAAGLMRLDRYEAFASEVLETKRALLDFLIAAKRKGQSIVGYGAPAKGNTLLNYCGVRTDFLDYTVDRSPHKQGLFLPGTRIPIHAPERIPITKPDYVLILPWNLKDEITAQMGIDPGVGRPVRGADSASRDLLMRFEETALPDVWIVTPELKEDHRGFFARTWCEREFAAHGITDRWVQCSVSFNTKKGTVRGLHYQRAPHEEAKLVRCTAGRLYDVVVDIRPGSPTFKKHVALELSAANRKMLYIAEGLRPRISDAGGCNRGLLSDLRVLLAGSRRRRALERSGVRDPMAYRRPDHFGSGPSVP